MQRLHHTDKEVKRLKNVKQDNNKHWKPLGLWYSIDTAWAEWCDNGRNFGLGKFMYEIEVDEKDLLILSTPLETRKFVKKYSHQKYPNLSFQHADINWEEVSKQFKGIEINPYFYGDLRFDRSIGTWYNSWDCSSGCIWDKSAILEINEVKCSKLELEVTR